MNITKLDLGTKRNSDIFQYILTNDNSMEVHILTWGATIQRIILPFSDGTKKNVVLSYADWTAYLTNAFYSGSTLAPNAGRIADSVLSINGVLYPLSMNEGKHNAHGGFHNASLQNWIETDSNIGSDKCSITLSLKLTNGLDGYPGNRIINACYELKNDNALYIHYHATTDKSTYFNISNHAYFNLSGNFNHSALEQLLEINASYYIANNHEHIPISIENCSNSPFDFSIPISPAENMALYPDNEQLKIAVGYNHSFLLNNNPSGINKALSIKDKISGYTMELYTDASSIVMYSGGFINDNMNLSDGFQSSKSCAIALEAQDPPNTPNFLPQYCSFTTTNTPYKRTIIYKFILSNESDYLSHKNTLL